MLHWREASWVPAWQPGEQGDHGPQGLQPPSVRHPGSAWHCSVPDLHVQFWQCLCTVSPGCSSCMGTAPSCSQMLPFLEGAHAQRQSSGGTQSPSCSSCPWGQAQAGRQRGVAMQAVSSRRSSQEWGHGLPQAKATRPPAHSGQLLVAHGQARLWRASPAQGSPPKRAGGLEQERVRTACPPQPPQPDQGPQAAQAPSSGQGGTEGHSWCCSCIPVSPCPSRPPGQPAPPCCGAGQEQTRCRMAASSPQLLEHGVHGDHSHQAPGTGQGSPVHSSLPWVQVQLLQPSPRGTLCPG